MKVEFRGNNSGDLLETITMDHAPRVNDHVQVDCGSIYIINEVLWLNQDIPQNKADLACVVTLLMRKGNSYARFLGYEY